MRSEGGPARDRTGEGERGAVGGVGVGKRKPERRTWGGIDGADGDEQRGKRRPGPECRNADGAGRLAAVLGRRGGGICNLVKNKKRTLDTCRADAVRYRVVGRNEALMSGISR
jgi:hypothetical protein